MSPLPPNDPSSELIAVNFSAQGTRWRVTAITPEKANEQHVPQLPGPGLLFTSTEAEMRFLLLAPDAVPTVEQLQKKSIGDLAALVQQAKPLDR